MESLKNFVIHAGTIDDLNLEPMFFGKKKFIPYSRIYSLSAPKNVAILAFARLLMDSDFVGVVNYKTFHSNLPGMIRVTGLPVKIDPDFKPFYDTVTKFDNELRDLVPYDIKR